MLPLPDKFDFHLILGKNPPDRGNHTDMVDSGGQSRIQSVDLWDWCHEPGNGGPSPPCQSREEGSNPPGQTVLSGLWRSLHPHSGTVTGGVDMGIGWACGSPGYTQPVWSDRWASAVGCSQFHFSVLRRLSPRATLSTLDSLDLFICNSFLID